MAVHFVFGKYIYIQYFCVFIMKYIWGVKKGVKYTLTPHKVLED